MRNNFYCEDFQFKIRKKYVLDIVSFLGMILFAYFICNVCYDMNVQWRFVVCLAFFSNIFWLRGRRNRFQYVVAIPFQIEILKDEIRVKSKYLWFYFVNSFNKGSCVIKRRRKKICIEDSKDQYNIVVINRQRMGIVFWTKEDLDGLQTVLEDKEWNVVME